jgi:hypothetical protein
MDALLTQLSIFVETNDVEKSPVWNFWGFRQESYRLEPSLGTFHPCQ